MVQVTTSVVVVIESGTAVHRFSQDNCLTLHELHRKVFYHRFGSADIYFRLNVFRSAHDH